jgi:hypothetical protein
MVNISASPAAVRDAPDRFYAVAVKVALWGGRLQGRNCRVETGDLGSGNFSVGFSAVGFRFLVLKFAIFGGRASLKT